MGWGIGMIRLPGGVRISLVQVTPGPDVHLDHFILIPPVFLYPLPTSSFFANTPLVVVYWWVSAICKKPKLCQPGTEWGSISYLRPFSWENQII